MVDETKESEKAEKVSEVKLKEEVCPDCGTQIRYLEGCFLCPACGHSKCG